MRRALLLLLLWTPAVISCGGDDAPEEPVIRPVRTLQVFSSGVARTRSFSGVARASMESRLSFKLAGTIETLSVKVGDQVRAGAPIASLDEADWVLQEQDAQAAVARAEAEARQAAATYARIRQLYENNNASRNDLDQARAASEAADAAAESTRKNLELARSRLGYTKLVAPMAGAISEVPVERNENVNAGQVVAVLSAGAREEVTVTMPETFIGRVSEGAAVGVTFDALPGRELYAHVTEVGVAASQGATYPVTVTLDEETPDVRPGMAAEVTFRFEAQGSNRIHVPASSVLEDRHGRFAFVVEPTGDGFGTVHRREVQVGDLTPEGIEIVTGLEDGDLLVTAGVTKIQDGLRVRVPGPEAGT